MTMWALHEHGWPSGDCEKRSHRLNKPNGAAARPGKLLN